MPRLKPGQERVLPFRVNAPASELTPDERAARDAHLRTIAKGGGHPKLDVLTSEDDWKNLDRLLSIQCTQREVAAFFGCSEDTILNRVKEVTGLRYFEYAAQVKPQGLASLRRKQFEMAMQGDRTMLIWLGKQYLNQADKVDQRVSGPDGQPIEVRDASNPVATVLGALAQIAGRHQIAAETVTTQAQLNAAHPLRALAGGDGRADDETIRERVRSVTESDGDAGP